MGEHYSPEEIAEGLNGRLRTKKSKEILRHLLRGCAECQAAVQLQHPRVTLRRKRNLPQEVSSAYNASLNRAEEMARRTAFLPLRERVRFRKALALLEIDNTVFALVDGDLELKGLGVYEALLARSWDLRYESPREMCHLARTAVQVAHRLESETYGPWRVSDYLARAWGELANALRVGDQFRESEEAFGKAFEFFGQGSQDRRILMRLLDLEASLLGTRREFSLALERLSFLSKLYHEAGERHMSGRTLVTKALYLYYKGDTHEASDTLAEGLGLIDKDRDPSLMVVSSLNQLLLLVECGRFKEARKFLFKNRGNLSGAGRTLLMRLRWTEGLISYGLGELESAEVSFREVKKSSADLGLEFARALAALDLTLTLMRQGRIEEAIQEGLASTEAFVRLSIHREILGSVILLHENFQAQTASLSLIESTVRYLRKRQVELNLK